MTPDPASDAKGSRPNRRSTRPLLWLTGLLLLAVAGVTVFLATLDASVYRNALERQLSAALGRKVSVGSVSIGLSLPLTLFARDLRVTNPGWASRPDFITAASGDVSVDLMALWHGQVELRALHLHGADVLMERNAEGAGNWSLGAPDRTDTPSAVPDFDAVTLTDARIAWRHGDGSTSQVQVDSAEATIRESAPFTLRGQVTYGDTPMRLALTADASLQAALGGKATQVSVTLEPKGASLTLDARLASLDALAGVEIGFELKGDHLDAWSAFVGQALPAWGPYRLSGQARYARAGLQLQGLRLLIDGLPMQPSPLQIDTGTAVFGADVDTRLTAAGKLGDTAFSLQAGSSPLATLRKADASLPLTLQATIAQFALSADGNVALTKGVPDFDLAMTGRGDAMQAVRLFASVAPGHTFPIDLAARVAHTRDGYSARSLRGRVFSTTVAGDLAFSQGQRPLLKGTLNLDRLDLGPSEGTVPEKSARDEAARAGTSTGAGAPLWLDTVDTDLDMRVATIAGLPIPLTRASARMQSSPGQIGLQGLAATLADTAVTGDGTVRWLGGRPQVDGSLRVALLDLAKPGASGTPSGSGSAIDATLPLAPLQALDGKLRLAIDRVVGGPVAIAKVAALARVQGGNLAVDVSSAIVADVPVQGQATLDASSSAWRVEANAKAARIDLEALLRSLNLSASASGVIQDVQLRIATEGTSLRALMAQATLALHSAPFALALGRDRSPVTVQSASIEAGPGGPVSANATGTALGAPMDLSVVGGSLVELLDYETAWPKVEAKLRATWGKELVQVNATSGPLRRLLGMRDVPLALQATMPGAQASLQGTLSNLAEPMATPLMGRVEVADLARTAALFPKVRLPAIPLTAAGRITLTDGEVSIDGLSVQAGRSDASGRLRVRWLGRPQLTADLSAKLIDTTQWEDRAADEPSVLDRPIDVKALLSQDAQLHLQAQRFILAPYDLAQFKFDGTLANGLVEFSAAAAEGSLQGDVRFDVRRDVPGVALHLSLKEVEAKTLYAAAATASGAATPRVSISSQLTGSGSTLRDMLATGQGELLLTAGAGELPIGATNGLERIAGNLLLVLLPGARTAEQAQLECAAAHFSIANGIATSSDGIALRLRHIDIVGSGAANLKTGEILFGYRAVRRELFSFSLLGLASGFAKVTGTIDNPTVALDPGGLLIQGSAAWATAGLSLLAGDLWRKLESGTDPCARIASGAQPMADPLEALIGELPLAKRLGPAAVKP